MAKQDPITLTPEEFEQRMHIKRSTRHNWQREGILVQNEHFYKIGGKLLYLWYADLPRELAENTRKVKARKEQTKAQKQTRTHESGPNWDY